MGQEGQRVKGSVSGPGPDLHLYNSVDDVIHLIQKVVFVFVSFQNMRRVTCYNLTLICLMFYPAL